MVHKNHSYVPKGLYLQVFKSESMPKHAIESIKRKRQAACGGENKNHYIKESVYHALVLDASNLANSIVQSGTMQRQMLMGCFYKHPYLHSYILIVFLQKVCDFGGQGVLYKFIGVGSALLVQLYWAMREPRSVGRVTGTDLHAFFIWLPRLFLTA